MNKKEKLAYAYWALLPGGAVLERLINEDLVDEDFQRKFLTEMKDELQLEDSLEQLMDPDYIRSIVEEYGQDPASSPLPIFRARQHVKEAANIDPSYKSFLDIVYSSRIDMLPSHALQGWLRSRNTIEFLLLWEKQNNKSFDRESAERLMAETTEKKATLTLKHWIARTGATGIVSLQGRYGATYAHPIIATDFEMWLLPSVRLAQLDSLYNYRSKKYQSESSGA